MSSDYNIKRFDGTTSVFLPGVQGKKGYRSRVFFYGNAKEPNDNHPKINFDGGSAFAIGDFEPEIYDYILYTDNTINYLYIISSIRKDGQNYDASVKKIDEIDFSGYSETSDDIGFSININTIPIQRTVRLPLSYNTILSDYTVTKTIITEKGPLYETTYFDVIFPKTTQKIINDELISIAVTNNFNKEFNSNLKIVIEFYSMQSFIMDTMLLDKFDSSNAQYNTYRGCTDKYSILIKDGDEWKERAVNFDDERLENFTYVIKDFDSDNGSKTIITEFPLMVTSLQRVMPEGMTQKAYIYAYIKKGDFVEKVFVDELDLNSILGKFSSKSYISNNQIHNYGSTSYQEPNTNVVINNIEIQTWRCQACGKVNNEEDSYCSSCGHPYGYDPSNDPLNNPDINNGSGVPGADTGVSGKTDTSINTGGSTPSQGSGTWKCSECGRINFIGLEHCLSCGHPYITTRS